MAVAFASSPDCQIRQGVEKSVVAAHEMQYIMINNNNNYRTKTDATDRKRTCVYAAD